MRLSFFYIVAHYMHIHIHENRLKPKNWNLYWIKFKCFLHCRWCSCRAVFSVQFNYNLKFKIWNSASTICCGSRIRLSSILILSDNLSKACFIEIEVFAISMIILQNAKTKIIIGKFSNKSNSTTSWLRKRKLHPPERRSKENCKTRE